MRNSLNSRWNLTLREFLFRLACRHRQGPRPNVLMHCAPRSGSTWLLNILAASSGMRYVGRPFQTALVSRWRREVPDLNVAARADGSVPVWVFTHFEGHAEEQFRAFARKIIYGQRHIYPTLNFRSPYFQRHTDRIVFQITHATALAEWFDAHFSVRTIVLMRHPIANALSIEALGWNHECNDFLRSSHFVDTHLTGAQVDLARRVVREGPNLAKLVLDVTFRSLVPFRAIQSNRHPEWILLTYEQLVCQSESIIQHLARRLDLQNVHAMLDQSRRPSATVTSTTAAQVANPEYLLDRWRRRVSAADERELLSIPATFGLDMYTPGNSKPHNPYWLGRVEVPASAA